MSNINHYRDGPKLFKKNNIFFTIYCLKGNNYSDQNVVNEFIELIKVINKKCYHECNCNYF